MTVRRTAGGCPCLVETRPEHLLHVHGINGDTRRMAGVRVTAALVAGRCDLFLTFDYENLGTTIVETTPWLLGERRRRLESSGRGTSRALTSPPTRWGLARGLVHRERVPGATGSSRKLVMLGMPNGGSPGPALADWATVAGARRRADHSRGRRGKVLRGLTAAQR